jgi:hypothetical protein
VNHQDRAGAVRYDGFDELRVHVERGRLDIDKHRHATAIADRVGRRYERMADGDHLVAGPDADSAQGEVEGRGAVGDCRRVWSANEVGELTLERRDLWALRDPATHQRPPDGLRLFLAGDRFGDGDHE